MKLTVQIDRQPSRAKTGKIIRRWKHKAERRRAKMDPECQPMYNRFDGYLS